MATAGECPSETTYACHGYIIDICACTLNEILVRCPLRNPLT